jgi:UDPglucose 6-dehydrogenase
MIPILLKFYISNFEFLVLVQQNERVCMDIFEDSVSMLYCQELPIEDVGIEGFLKTKPLHFLASLDKPEAYEGTD